MTEAKPALCTFECGELNAVTIIIRDPGMRASERGLITELTNRSSRLVRERARTGARRTAAELNRSTPRPFRSFKNLKKDTAHIRSKWFWAGF